MHRSEDNIKMCLTRWIQLAQNTVQNRPCLYELANEPLGSIKEGNS